MAVSRSAARGSHPGTGTDSVGAVDRLHVFLGTKAQYVKTGPLLRLMDARGVDYRLIDSGQHAALTTQLRRELGVRLPDHSLGGDRDITRTTQAAGWALGIAARLRSGRRLREEVFGGDGGICVVHGDTPTTFLAAALAKRAGLRTAHLEAGLRSHSLLHPFPEELVRLAVMRVSDILFAPDTEAVQNLAAMGLQARTVPVEGNTVLEALGHSLADDVAPGSGPVVITMHRVENLTSARRSARLVELACELARARPVTFVVHGPTADTFAKRGADAQLEQAGVTVVPLAPHADFVRMLAAAPFVVTDGGSVQEECALLGVPTLIWRARTERSDGLGENAVLSGYDEGVVATFLDDPERHRRARRRPDVAPSEQILEVLLRELAQPRRRDRATR